MKVLDAFAWLCVMLGMLMLLGMFSILYAELLN